MRVEGKSRLHVLDLSEKEMLSLVNQASDLIVKYLSNMADEPSSNLNNISSHLASIRDSITEQATPLEEILPLIRNDIIGCAVNTAGGTYQAYIPGGGVFAAAVGELIAAASNRYAGVGGVAPVAVEVELTVIRWLCKLANYPKTAKGILTSGGSMANFSAIVTARRTLLPENFFSGIIYASDQVHLSIQKAALLAGFPPKNVRMIASDKNFCIKTEDLLKNIQADKDAGLQPFLIVGSAGTTNTGAVDPLSTLASIAQEYNLWLHIDAAYGGFFLLTERGQELFQGIEKADSITLDPHKGMFLPYGTGCLLVRDGDLLKQAHQVTANYLQDLDLNEEIVNFNDYSPELTRSFRGLRVWLPLKLYGAASFREYLDEKLDLAIWACEELKKIPNIKIIAEPQLSVVAFRYQPKTGDVNQTNKKLLKEINATGKTFISSTTIDGQVVLRVAILCFRTHLAEVQNTIQAIKLAISMIENT
jgi:aromatic-L-amino-acid decarboxylase